MSAKIWFDLNDILFLRLNKIPIPALQPLGDLDDICRYLGPRGCRLARIERPFICTRYLCPPQMSLLRKDQQAEQRFLTVIHRIKSKRGEIENEFIEITSTL